MPIKVWEYLAEYADERSDILNAVDHVFSSGNLVLGASVEKFEKSFAKYHGVSECVSVDNGTNAIRLGLESLGVGAGDEVITVSNTAAATVLAIDATGAKPVFVDVDERTQLMDTSLIEQAITPRTRCLIPVHLFGQCVDMDEVLRIATQNDLAVLEDCAQAHGASHRGRMAGSMGDIGAFSFYPTKVLGAYGDGGAVVTSRSDCARSIRRLRYYGMEEGRNHVVSTPGYNTRLDEVQAEILNRKLARLDQYISARRVIAERYDNALSGTGLKLPTTCKENTHVYYLYVVRHPRRDDILSSLREQGIHLNISYPHPVHTADGFRHLGYSVGSLPVTESLADEIFSLPMYPSLSATDQLSVIDAVRSVLLAKD